MNDPNANIRAAVAGAPAQPSPLPPRRDDEPTPIATVARAALTAANTKQVGFGGVALVFVANVLPALVPAIDHRILAAHVPPLAAHAAVAMVGAAMAILGRWRTFSKP